MIDDEAVKRLVREAWVYYSEIPDPALRANQIYLDLYTQRNSGDATIEGSPEVAAAEHYYYARQLVSYEGYPVMEAKALVLGYQAFKTVKFAIKDADATHKYAPDWFVDWITKLGRHDPNKPMTPPSEALKRWGINGCVDGEADRKVSAMSPKPRWQKPPQYSGNRR